MNIELSENESLVLYDFLVYLNEEKDYVFRDQSEQRVSWDLECLLESNLVQIFSKDYDILLKKAREEIRDVSLDVGLGSNEIITQDIKNFQEQNKSLENEQDLER